MLLGLKTSFSFEYDLQRIPSIVLRADIKPMVDGEAAHRAASPSISVLTYLRIAIERDEF